MIVCPITKAELAQSSNRFVSDAGLEVFKTVVSGLGSTMEALDAALGKELKFGSQILVRSKGVVSALPYSLTASEARYVCRQTVLVWVDWLAGCRGVAVPETWQQVGEFFIAQATWLALSSDGAQCVDEVSAAVTTALSICDPPRPLKWLGSCIECGGRLLSYSLSLDSIVCRCGVVNDVLQRREAALRSQGEKMLRPVEAAALLSAVGVPVPASTVRSWIYRGRLLLREEGLVRLGDVLELVWERKETAND